MKLVACSHCHARYDISDYRWERFACACGHVVEAQAPSPKRAHIAVHNCGSCGAPKAKAEKK